MEKEQVKYPEHNKLSKVKDQSQWLGSFIEWAQEQGWSLRQYDDETKEWYRVRKDINQMLGEYLGVSLIKLNEEKEQMVEEMREVQKYDWIRKDVTVYYKVSAGVISATVTKVTDIVEVENIGGVYILDKEQCYKTYEEVPQ